MKLDLAENKTLTHLDCGGNRLTNLNLTNNCLLNSSNVRCDHSVHINWCKSP